MSEYSMEKLREIFLDHAAEAVRSNAEHRQQFMENNPGEPLPEHMLSDFSLPEALSSICDEIMRLKDQQHN